MKAILGILSLMVLLVSGCAHETLTGSQCDNVDWERIGVIDGENGIFNGQYKAHAKACNKARSESDMELYSIGHKKGLKTFCTAENGYKMGSLGFMSGEVCSTKEYPEFAEQFALGRDVFALESKRRDIINKKDDFNNSQAVVDQIHQGISLLSGKSPTERLDREQAEIESKIKFLKSNSSVNSPASGDFATLMALKDVAPVNVSYALNKTGAFIGTFFGFGIGHAIQGRYKDDGWKWTLGEVATIGYMASTWTADDETQCKAPPPEQRVPGESYCGGSVNGFALVAWLGFRVWQSYDLWSYGSSSSLYANSTVIGKPDGFLYVYRF